MVVMGAMAVLVVIFEVLGRGDDAHSYRPIHRHPLLLKGLMSLYTCV